MLTKPLDDLQAHYSDLKQLCLSSDEPIFLKDKWRNRLVLMNCEFYEKLTAEYDMTRYGLWLDTGEMRKRNETPLPYAEITDEPIFVSDGDGRDIIFMTPALYHVLAGNISRSKAAGKFKIKIEKKQTHSHNEPRHNCAKIYPFEKSDKK